MFFSSRAFLAGSENIQFNTCLFIQKKINRWFKLKKMIFYKIPRFVQIIGFLSIQNQYIMIFSSRKLNADS